MLQVFQKRMRVFVRRVVDCYRIWATQRRHLCTLKSLQQQDTYSVVFFVLHASIWKYDFLYRLFDSDSGFNPVIIVCPHIGVEKHIMHSDLEKTYNFFKSKDYNVMSSYKSNSDTWLDVKTELAPDIVFFTNPHRITLDQFYINTWHDTLTCYVQYSFHVSHLNKLQYDQLFHNLLWRFFCESSIHVAFAKQFARNRGVNTMMTGYPGIDEFLIDNEPKISVFNVKNTQVKKVIWAPHHTILKDECDLGYSNFLQYAEFFLQIPLHFRNRVKIAFKPHPLLKQKLYLHPDWGRVRTDSYYKNWEKERMTLLVEGAYIDLFRDSDTLIHDSGSFLVEYLYLHKPVAFCVRNRRIHENFNEFGRLALKVHYKVNDQNEILDYIEDVVFNSQDIFRQEREDFFAEYLQPPNQTYASQNIYNEIVRALVS